MAQDPARVRACYDTVADQYAARFVDELASKPFDREVLEAFAADLRGAGRVCELGCGCGHIGAFLAARGVDVFGLDLSEGQIREGRKLFPSLELRVGDMLDVDLADESASGVVAFYAIVHFTPDQLEVAVREMYRILAPGGRLLLTFHIGRDPIRLDEFLDRSVAIDFMFFSVAQVVACLESAGFEQVTARERGPYPDVEAQTRRAYVQARKPG